MPIVVGVPGPWADADEVVRALLEAGAAAEPRFLPMIRAGTLVDVRAGRQVGLDVERGSELHARAFELGAGGRVPAADLERVRRHRTIVWLVSDELGLEAARALSVFAIALLDAGGHGVKVDSAGRSHGPAGFRRLARLGTLGLYDAFVTLVGGPEGYWSSGLHQLGLRDVAAPSEVPADRVAGLLTAFAQWCLLTRPALRGGELFAEALGEPVYEVRPTTDDGPRDALTTNPGGRWSLVPTTRPLELARAVPDSGEPMFAAISANDPAWLAGREAARATFGRLVEHARERDFGLGMFKIRLVEGEEEAFVWLVLDRLDGEELSGRFFELPPEFPLHRALGGLTVGREAVEDWAIVRAGAVIGGFSLRLQHDHTRPEHRRHLALYTGHLCFAPLEELAPWTVPGPELPGAVPRR